MSKTHDIARQGLNLILAPAMWVCSSLNIFFGLGRSIEEQSDATYTLLVPFGAAFSIWLPIFVGCISYGIYQALPKNRERAIFRDTGWLTAGAFALVSLWGIVATFPPIEASKWLTALVFVPAVLLICRAVFLYRSRYGEVPGAQGWLSWIPLSWLAGWCSIAVFLNWAQLGVHGPLGFGMSPLVICILSLALALAWVTFMLYKTGGSAAYVFPVVWGLGWLVFVRLSENNYSQPIAIMAGLGALVLIFSTWHRKRVSRRMA